MAANKLSHDTTLTDADKADATSLSKMKHAISGYEYLAKLLGFQLSQSYVDLNGELNLASKSLELSQVILTKRGEAKICAIVDYLAFTNNAILTKYFNSEIVDFDREFKLETGLVDRVFYHADGSVSTVEIKGFGSRRDHAQAIGQVLMYAEAMRELKQTNRVTKAIVLFGERDYWIDIACKSADIIYINVPRAMIETLEQCAALNSAILKNELI